MLTQAQMLYQTPHPVVVMRFSFGRRLATEWRAALELFVLPATAVCLPWPLCFRWFRWLCQHTPIYQDAALESLRQAKAYGVVQDEQLWLWQRKLVTLIDHADLYLSRWRGAKWIDRHLQREGNWPPAGHPGVLMTFHWAAGLWGIRDAARCGLRPHMLLALGHDTGSWVSNRYIQARAAEVQRASARPVVAVDVRQADPSASNRSRVNRARLFEVLESRDQLLAVIDVPADQMGRSVPVVLNGWSARAALGLFDLCVSTQTPLTLYWTDVCLNTGKRRVVVCPMAACDSAQALATQAFSELEKLLQHSPQKWHFWSLANRFFVPPEPASTAL